MKKIILAMMVIVTMFTASAYAQLTPFKSDVTDQLKAEFGIFAIVILLAIDWITPPYPSSEIILMAPLRFFFGIPLLISNIISIVIAFIILIVASTQAPYIWNLLDWSWFLTPFGVIVTIILGSTLVYLFTEGI